MTIYSNINTIEEKFKYNNYNGKSKKSYTVNRYNSKIILSAPHSVNQIRNGQLKHSEVYTGSMVEILSKICFVNSIVKISNDNNDANFDDISKYREKIVSIVNKQGIKFLLDIHGASEDRDFDFEIGTANGNNINFDNKILNLCISLADKLGFTKVNVDNTFTASNKNTISRYVNEKTKIYTIQIEINKKYRSPNSNSHDFIRMMEYLSNLIYIIEQYLEKQALFLSISKISKGTWLNPINKIELPNEYFNNLGLNINEEVELVNHKGQILKCISKISPDNQVYISSRYFDDFFKLSNNVAIFKQNYYNVSILKPRIEITKNNTLLVSKDIYDIAKDKHVELLNSTNNRKITINTEIYPYHNDRKNMIWLNYYQRQLLGAEFPKILSLLELNEFKQQISNYENIQLSDDCFSEENNLYTISPKIKIEEYDKISRFYRNKFCAFKWKLASENTKKKIYEKFLDRLIGKRELYLIAGRGDEKDDGNDLVRMTTNTMKILGIAETDNVIIRYNGLEITLRALSFDDIDKEKIKRSNGINNNEDIEYLISIPAKYRLKLGIFDSGISVLVERSTKYLFIKNINAQLLSVFGSIITITQLPIESIWLKTLLIAISIPIIINVVLSYERAKISN